MPDIYYAHDREVVLRRGLLVPVTELTLLALEKRSSRDACASAPWATSPAPAPWPPMRQPWTKIIAETAVTTVTERGATRMDDQTSDASMELRKREGYFR